VAGVEEEGDERGVGALVEGFELGGGGGGLELVVVRKGESDTPGKATGGVQAVDFLL